MRSCVLQTFIKLEEIMAKILINKEAIECVLETFFKENTHCIKKEIRTSANKIICKFCVERKECRVDIHILRDGIRPVTVGKHHEDSSILLRYLESKGTIDDQVSQQFVIKDTTILKDILEYIKTDFEGKIKIEQKENKYILTSFCDDKLTITINQNNILFQGKPYYTFNIVYTFIANLDLISFDEYVLMGQNFSDDTYSPNIIRNKIKDILIHSYAYMEEAQIKSISGSFSFINKNVSSEDYSSPLTGVFKALEGYIKKLLTQKYGFIIRSKGTLSPFKKDKSGLTEIDKRTDILSKDKDALYLLYELYCDQRNVYTHSTVDPAQMRVIQDYKEAEELRDNILAKIEETYNKIFKV